MLSKRVVLSKQSLGVFITAGALGLGLFMGSAGAGRAQDKGATPPAPTGPQAQSTEEFNEASAAQTEKDDAKRLVLLDKWKKDFPTTPLVDARHAFYLTTYVNLKMARQAFDQAQEILKDHPTDYLPLADAIQMVMAIKPAPSPADLDTGEKNALTLLDNGAVWAAGAKPAGMTDAAWAQLKGAVQPYAEKILLAIYVARKDDKRALGDIRQLINRDPTLATASFELGSAMQRIIKAEDKTQDLPLMFWQFARAISVAGPNALPAANKTSAQNYLTQAYTAYHGSAQGLPELIAQAKDNPFPPAGFSLKSTVDIAKEAAAADEAERNKDPLIYLWVHTLKESLLKDGGDQYFEDNVKDAALPPDKDGMPQYFKGKIISMSPNPKPKEIIVAVEKGDVGDAKLTFESPLAGKMEPGEEIQFKGAAKEFTKSPFMITFLIVDPKEDMNGTWTGKNTPAPRPPAGRGGGGKAANKSGGTSTK